jgi:rubrerythrin
MEQRKRFDEAAGIIRSGDEELFERVWRRVKGGAEGGENIPPMPGKRAAAPCPEENMPVPPPDGDSDLIGTIRQSIENELHDSQRYRVLACHARQDAACGLLRLAGEELRHAGRLSAALFLLTGNRYFPEQRETACSFSSRWEGLRLQYEREEADRQTYRSLAASMSDLVLRETFLELAEEEGDHARLLRAMIEREAQAMPCTWD